VFVVVVVVSELMVVVSSTARLDVVPSCQFHAIVADAAHQPKRMAASDSARLDVVLRCQLHAIVADIARCYRSRHVDCYLPSSGFRGDSPGMDLATLDTGDGRRRYNSSLAKERDWYRRTVRRYGETYDPNPSRQCEPISSTMCWIGLARKVS
jgi:hypothetical protein